MNNSQQEHPDHDRLMAFGLGQLGQDEQAEVERHVAGCHVCCEALREVPDDALLARLRHALPATRPDSPSATPTVLATDAAVPRELADHSRYRVLKLLGSGGMGAVYQAEHRLMERMVALKVIRRALTDDPAAAERFRREVRAAGRLAHPNIVAAHDADQAGDLHFLVMEYVAGVSLDRLSELRGPLSVGWACACARQVAQGLQHAHERGMVHRDIKPQNLMLTAQGKVKILDFGLAAFARTEAQDNGREGTGGRLTSPGAMLGTPDFMAPEQANDARSADIRADIYSLGCTLYFLLTGRPPFPQEGFTDKLLAHLHEQPRPLAELRDDLPPGLAEVVGRMMAKDPAQRYLTPAEVAEALAPFARLSSARRKGPEEAPARVAGSATGRQPPVPAAVHAPPTAATVPQTLSHGPAETQAQSRRKRRAPRRTPYVPWVAAAVVLAVVGSAVIALALLGNRGGSPQGNAGQTNGSEARRRGPAGNPPGVPEQGAGAQGARVLLVVPHDGVWYQDYSPVRDVLTQGGAKITVASSVLGPARASRGSPGPDVATDIPLANARAADYDAIVFTGENVSEFIEAAGADARRMMTDMRRGGKVVAGLCKGMWVLVDAGLLQGQRASWTPHVPREVLMRSGAEWSKEAVVVSGRVITAGNFQNAREFAQKLLNLLASGG